MENCNVAGSIEFEFDRNVFFEISDHMPNEVLAEFDEGNNWNGRYYLSADWAG